ncbi:2'-deoxycytidine 5'-triphosphate deaminase [bacterium]|nr:2'-deoxycytidine 5'-triphosphate deaminase [bacterium]
MNKKPWIKWRPGVLSKRQVKDLVDSGYITNVNDIKCIDHSAMDLHLSNEGCIMLQGSVKPNGPRYAHFLEPNHGYAEKLIPDNDGCYILRTNTTYVFKLVEELKGFRGSNIYGHATGKSTIGRVDVLVRLIVDGMDCYDSFNHDKAEGDLFLEITPITFDIRVKAGIALTQLRFIFGPDELSIITKEQLYLYGNEPKLISQNQNNEETDSLSVDLSQDEVGNSAASAFRSKPDASKPPIDLWEIGKFDPKEYWDLVSCDKEERIKIEKNSFYILRSKERIQLPGSIAVYCKAMDETIGEMRIHYAGFVHPFFGSNKDDDIKGTPLIFEVRGHNVDVSLSDNEKMAKLIFYRMSEDAELDKKEPISVKKTQAKTKDYQYQSLTLSKIFGNWI